MAIIREAMQTIVRAMMEVEAELNRTKRARGNYLLRRAKIRLTILERRGSMDIRIPVPSHQEREGRRG